MKNTIRILAVLMALLCVGTLAGCAGKTEPADTPAVSAADAPRLEDVYGQILDLKVLPEMYVLGDDYVQSYYGIPAEAISDRIFAVADDPMMADTLIIVHVSAAGDAAAIEEGFRTINMQRLQEMESYNPEQYQRAEKAVIKTSGSYVCYIISDDNDAIVKLIENSIG